MIVSVLRLVCTAVRIFFGAIALAAALISFDQRNLAAPKQWALPVRKNKTPSCLNPGQDGVLFR